MVCYIQGLVQIFTNIKTHKCYTSGFCLNWAVCGPTHNWDHWQLILMSSREQNSHCCSSLLVTAGLPFLGLLAGWAAAIPKSHKSSLKLMLIANFCYIKIPFFSTVVLYVAVNSFHVLFHPGACLLCRSSFSTVRIQAFPNSGKYSLWDSLLQFWRGKKYFISSFFSCIHSFPQGSFWVFSIYFNLH